jgi:3-deoxy-D-manno-octulosonic acid kinase
MVLTQIYGSYRFGSSSHLSEQQMRRFIRLFKRSTPAVLSVLDGRSSVAFDQIVGIGSVVVKNYTRGGLIRNFVKRRYLNLGKTRGQMEYELLLKVKSLGINAPDPIAYAYHGRLFYLAWLVTREIVQPLSLARMSLEDEKHAQKAMKSAVDQISRLIDNDIYHVDLHPGNVVVDREDRVFLVDFDKGYVFRGKKEKLRKKYLARWERAVRKHRLPIMLSEIMFSGLRLNSDGR